MKAKIVKDPHYHLWTDALHARALAQQAANNWDRGAYVRWTVNAAWTAFEVACGDALGKSGLGNRFKENVDDAMQALSLPTLIWGNGLWSRVLGIYTLRKDFTHKSLPQSILMATDTSKAENAISVLRDAIEDIYTRVGKTVPDWINDDYDRGWDDGKGPISYLTGLHGGATMDDSTTVRLVYVYKGRECVHGVHPSGTDISSYIDELLNSLIVPITSIRVYEGPILIQELPVQMR